MRLRMGSLLAGVRAYPTVAVSVLIICFLVGVGIYAALSLPLHEAIEMWSAGDEVWGSTPRLAQPAWTNVFRREKLPVTQVIQMSDFPTNREAIRDTTRRETTILSFEHSTPRFPSEATLFYTIEYATKVPLLTLTWIKPNGSEIRLYHGTARGGPARIGLDLDEVFGSEESDMVDASAFEGNYTLKAEVLVFEEDGFSLDAELVVYGGVYGIAGTDGDRRNLWVGLMWGTPIALMIGLIAATGTTVFGFVVAAIGAWFGGWVDASIQRLTEVSMMIPFLPTILMVGWFYSSSIWVLLAFIIGFSLFSGPLKTYRAMFLQVTHSQYIEAARAYGAGNMRIIFRYLIPRMVPALLPRLILGVPLFVFLETSLAFLGIADPNLPTWGKILSEAREALYMGHYHWVLGPAFMLLLTGLSFSMLGYTLDRVFNPRLRDI